MSERPPTLENEEFGEHLYKAAVERSGTMRSQAKKVWK